MKIWEVFETQEDAMCEDIEKKLNEIEEKGWTIVSVYRICYNIQRIVAYKEQK